ncbi:hypothetical protein EVAR_11643_1 [Eumeta japonica]|uniref:Uncharacterized protein n=1 Tax=Eumeta variegata TaxID=151549 RepID=A0A4C1WVI2_EUMVA|nr:hypothetical protein EVAR_11643_1 [Eumeta japonica]
MRMRAKRTFVTSTFLYCTEPSWREGRRPRGFSATARPPVRRGPPTVPDVPAASVASFYVTICIQFPVNDRIPSADRFALRVLAEARRPVSCAAGGGARLGSLSY